MAGLAKQLGVKPGHVVCLLNSPAEAAALLRQECLEGAGLCDALERGPYNVILFWPTQLAGSSDHFAQLQQRIVAATTPTGVNREGLYEKGAQC